MNSSYLLIFALLALSINCQGFYSINLNKTLYPVAQPLNSSQNTTNLCYFNDIVTLTPISIPNQKGNFSGFSINGQYNINVTNCRVPSIINFVQSQNDTTRLAINSTVNSTDFNKVFVVDNVNTNLIYKLINSVNNADSANLNLYVYHNDTGINNRVLQVLQLTATSLIVTLALGLLALLY
ncbi:hypothetical protein ABPG72_022489 [Tetrahymena utriculariae]